MDRPSYTLTSSLLGIPISDIADFFGVVFGLFALVVSFLAWRTSVKSQKIAIANDAMSRPKLELEIMSFKHDRIGSEIWIEVEMLISNPTDKDNAVKRLELRLDYQISDIISNLLLAASAECKKNKEYADKQQLVQGGRFLARSAVLGIAVFRFPAEVAKDNRLLRQTISLTDTSDKKYDITLRPTY